MAIYKNFTHMWCMIYKNLWYYIYNRKRKGKLGESRGHKAMGLYATYVSNDCQAAERLSGRVVCIFFMKKEIAFCDFFYI